MVPPFLAFSFYAVWVNLGNPMVCFFTTTCTLHHEKKGPGEKSNTKNKNKHVENGPSPRQKERNIFRKLFILFFLLILFFCVGMRFIIPILHWEVWGCMRIDI